MLQSELKEVLHVLGHLSSSLPGSASSSCLALPAPTSPCCHARPDSKAHHRELQSLRTEIALLRVRMYSDHKHAVSYSVAS